MLGVKPTPSLFIYGYPQRRFGADHWTGQASNQRSTPSYVERLVARLKPRGENREAKTGSPDQPIAAQAAQA